MRLHVGPHAFLLVQDLMGPLSLLEPREAGLAAVAWAVNSCLGDYAGAADFRHALLTRRAHFVGDFGGVWPIAEDLDPPGARRAWEMWQRCGGEDAPADAVIVSYFRGRAAVTWSAL